MARPKDPPYKNISKIPPHIFKDRLLTEAVTPELRNYLRYMLEKNPNNLWYLYKRAQEYKDIEGAQYVMHFPKWIHKLTKSLEKTEEQDNKDK